ncbi:SMP-30/gluconolactonase/LRE family protein [Pontibacter beigongshangensis]|uniref:SMP-30/gluconolactonase/LRE family protein n=1 Tax=Pontibacter beigongshangensis TaxID=2574733 RepID=UPI00164FD559|nr:SMP-30/gluconolactonase/LRE family protein [Pontibacter beigongshangensis]
MRALLPYLLLLLTAPFFTSCRSGLFGGGAPVTLKEAWASDNTLRTPESVLHDPQRNVIYVSNINKRTTDRKDGDGFISILSPHGEVEQLYWVAGLNNPKGMALFNNILYVADIDEVVAISTQSGAILDRFKADKATNLNDVTVDSEGNVYISDSQEGKIYLLRNGRISTWMDKTKNEMPNGLLYDQNRLIVAFASSGHVRLLDTRRKRFTDWTEGIASADGIAVDGAGGFFISNWHGEIYYVNQRGKKWLVLDTKAEKVNTADIAYSQQLQLLLVPTFLDNRVVAYTVK